VASGASRKLAYLSVRRCQSRIFICIDFYFIISIALDFIFQHCCQNTAKIP